NKSLTRLSLISLFISTSFYSIQSFADDPKWTPEYGTVPSGTAFGVALGDESQVLNQSNGKPSHASVAIGGLAKAQNLGSIAIGYKSEAGLDNATTGEQGDAFSYAIGREAKAPKSGLAFGSSAEALGNEAIAIGTHSYSKDGIGAMAIGVGSRVAVLEKGKSNKIDNQNSKVVEVDAEGRVNKISVDRTSEADIIKKSGATYGALAFGWKASSHNLFATSIGAFSTVAAIEGTAVGGGTQVTGYRGSAFGMHSKAQAEKSLALGYESEAAAYNSVALGASSLANRPNTVSVGDGNYNLYRQITNVADGTQENDAVNVRQLNAQAQRLTKEYRSGIASAIAIGGLQSASIPGKQGVSVGVGNFKGENSLAVGYSRLSSDGSVSLKINAALSSSGYSGGGASVGFMW
ncbi:TPA: YadA family autotransporter adhesin, partial [Haemophilus influenzae]